MHKGVLRVMFVFHQFLFIKQTYLNGLSGYFHTSCNLVHIVSFGIYCSVLESGGGGVGWGGLISNLSYVRLQFLGALWKRGIHVIFHYTLANEVWGAGGILESACRSVGRSAGQNLVLLMYTNIMFIQSVENAGVAFVKRADGINKFFEKIKIQ